MRDRAIKLRRRGSRARRWRCGFTLIEILIVVTILGILGAMILPKFSSAYSTAAQNTLKDELRYMRTQIVVYKAQHRDVPPGYPPANPGGVPNAADFADQMTKRTDEFGRTGNEPLVHRLGPYLQKMPPNPVNRLSTVLVVQNGAALPAPDNSTGWIYKPETLEFLTNLSGTDTDGTPYINY